MHIRIHMHIHIHRYILYIYKDSVSKNRHLEAQMNSVMPADVSKALCQLEAGNELNVPHHSNRFPLILKPPLVSHINFPGPAGTQPNTKPFLRTRGGGVQGLRP